MANIQANKVQIRIDSILGGHSRTTHFATADQFLTSLGIDPGLPSKEGQLSTTQTFAAKASGLLRPSTIQSSTQGYAGSSPIMWIFDDPKKGALYVYASNGSAFSSTSPTFTGSQALNDAGTLSNSIGNGADYYDNYVYFAKNTTITRYGPLDGTAGFVDDYWSGVLGKANLTNTTYPTRYGTPSLKFPNHILHRHSDGRLYIADVVGNKGTLHFIQTTKSTVEGDTDNGSTFGALTFGYGLWPTAIESYGSSLAIALHEGGSGGAKRRALLSFWDTTSQNFNSITYAEFPDQIISSLKNINGVLYIASCDLSNQGFRVSKYIGGLSFQQVAYFDTATTPMAGAMDGAADRLLFGSSTASPEASAVVYSLGLAASGISNGLFAPARIGTTGLTGPSVTALFLNTGFNYLNPYLIVGWGDGSGNVGIDMNNDAVIYSSRPAVWWSKLYTPGQPFKITKIRIPFAQPIAANMTVTAKLYTDDSAGTTYTFQTINNTNYSHNEKNIVFRSDASGTAPVGSHNFWLELRWTGSALCVIALPIIIEYEIIDD